MNIALCPPLQADWDGLCRRLGFPSAQVQLQRDVMGPATGEQHISLSLSLSLPVCRQCEQKPVACPFMAPCLCTALLRQCPVSVGAAGCDSGHMPSVLAVPPGTEQGGQGQGGQ